MNFHILPTTMRWLWPTLVGTPAIAIWITYYKRRFNAPKSGAVAPAA